MLDVMVCFQLVIVLIFMREREGEREVRVVNTKRIEGDRPLFRGVSLMGNKARFWNRKRKRKR